YPTMSVVHGKLVTLSPHPSRRSESVQELIGIHGRSSVTSVSLCFKSFNTSGLQLQPQRSHGSTHSFPSRFFIFGMKHRDTEDTAFHHAPIPRTVAHSEFPDCSSLWSGRPPLVCTFSSCDRRPPVRRGRRRGRSTATKPAARNRCFRS